MLVDPEVLRAFAGHVDIVSGRITGAAVGPTTTSAADATLASNFDGLF